jgi:DNA ligase-1
MAHGFRVMLAPNDDPLRRPAFFDDLQYPLSCSPKYDGIRGTVKEQTVISRKGILLPSFQVQEEFNTHNHVDGELIEGSPMDFGVYHRTNSHVMSHNKPGDLRYFLFDYNHPDWLDIPFYQRLDHLKELDLDPSLYEIIEHVNVDNEAELLAYEESQLALGFEGIMMRDPVGRYKTGRATWLEGLIYKLKRFTDDEARIVDLIEGQINNNPKEIDELGYAKRSTKKEGMVKAGTLGKFKVLYKGEVVSVAPGSFKHKARQEIWDDPTLAIGKLLKFRFFEHGMKDNLRFPRALGFREEIDL